MKLNFNYRFTRKRILAIVEAVLAIGIFFFYFAPQLYYYTSIGHVKTYYNGFESYLGKSSDFSLTFGGVFYIILLFAVAALCVTKLFVSDKKYKLFNVLAIILAIVAIVFISLASTSLMINTTKDTARIAHAYGSFLLLGATVLLGAFILVDQLFIRN